jgi:hypothetical protein
LLIYLYRTGVLGSPLRIVIGIRYLGVQRSGVRRARAANLRGSVRVDVTALAGIFEEAAGSLALPTFQWGE